MSNPNNAFGTNAAFGGRTSPNAFNDVMGAFQSRGILSGWACSPDSGMSVVFGGDGTTRDVAIAEDNSGNKLSVNNIPGTPISVTIAAAPATQTRIDAVVAYIENPPQGTSTATDNYGAVNVLDVQGTASSSPTAPDDNAIRTAITTDGASGSTAYYVVLAYITVASGTTDITSNLIEAGPSAELQTALTNIPADTITTDMIQSAAVTSNKIDWTTINRVNYSTNEEVWGKWIDGSTLYRKTFVLYPTQSLENIQLDTLMNVIVKAEVVYDTSSGSQKNYVLAPYYVSGSDYFRFFMRTENNKTYVCSRIGSNNISGVVSATFTFWYTK